VLAILISNTPTRDSPSYSHTRIHGTFKQKVAKTKKRAGTKTYIRAHSEQKVTEQNTD
jgi:hypothetical protein